MATTLRTLKLDDLEKAEVFTVVWDKYGNKFFKLADHKWAAQELTAIESKDLVKRRVRLY